MQEQILRTSLVAENSYITYVTTLNPETNELLYKTVELINLRVARTGDVIALVSYPSDKIAPGDVQLKVLPNCTIYDILLRNGLSIQITGGFVYAFSYSKDSFDFYDIQEIQVMPTDYALLIDASASIAKLDNVDKQVSKKSPCRRCHRTYIVFRSMLNEGLWPVFVGSNQITSDINAYNIIQKQGKQYIVSDIVKIVSKNNINVLTTEITRLEQKPMRVNYVVYL